MARGGAAMVAELRTDHERDVGSAGANPACRFESRPVSICCHDSLTWRTFS
jgi:hypothetical protein